MKQLHIGIVAILLVIAVATGWLLGQKHFNLMPDGSVKRQSAKMQKDVNGVVQDSSGKTVKYWYDPMVPDQKFDKPGKSPFMDMQLEPKYASEGSNGEEAGVAISSLTAQNLGIRLQKVSSKSFGESFSAVGRIEPDERRLYVVQTRVPGFIERLSVRAVGDPVTKGQKIADIYAPELLAAQQEYLALLTLKGVDTDDTLKQAARNRLKLLGMSDGEVNAITKAGKASPRFGVYAPSSGVVTELGVREGGQLMPGSSLMQITDLSNVWLIAEVPERDAARLKPGLSAEVKLQSLPEDIFKGKVSYLYPLLNENSRTLQVRIELPNKGNRLRPGMYGNVMFAGQTHEALSVPTESVIATGTRKIVIVKETNGYRPVEVETGQESNGWTEILKGLNEGEEVVVSGQFLIDSEASLSGVLARLSQQKPMSEDIGDKNSMPIDMDKKVSDKTVPDKVVEKMPKGTGKVLEIDAKASKVILNHEPIPELGWPSMTMGFKVKDSQQLSKLKVGDAVEFDLKADSQNQYMIERMEKRDAKAGAKP